MSCESAENVPFMPREVTPWLTAFRAYSGMMLLIVLTDLFYHSLPICTSFPLKIGQ